MLGLIIIPSTQSRLALVDPVSILETWGIGASQLTSGTPGKETLNLGFVVGHMRNSLCHFHFRPEPLEADAERIVFEDTQGFRLVLSIDQLKSFVHGLAQKLKALP